MMEITPYFVKDIKRYVHLSVDTCKEIKPVTVNYFDLTFVTRGSLTYYLNNRKYVLTDGDAIFVPPNTLRKRDSTDKSVSYTSFNFYLLDSVNLDLDIFLPKIISNNIIDLLSINGNVNLLNLSYEKEKLVNLLNYIILEIMQNQNSHDINQYVNIATQYIDEHLDSKLSLEVISNYLSLSKEYFAKLFKTETGKTVGEYIASRKMRLAKQLIRDNELSLSEISKLLCFEDYNYFSRAFKKNCGISPIYYRKQHKN